MEKDMKKDTELLGDADAGKEKDNEMIKDEDLEGVAGGAREFRPAENSLPVIG